MLMLPSVPVSPELDMSWAGALPYFAQRGLRFGTDIIFTYGPLGHLSTYAYTGYLSSERMIWEFVSRGCEAVLITWALLKLRLVIRIGLAVCILFFLGNYEEAHGFVVVLIGLLLLRSTDRNLRLAGLMAFFLGVLGLVKFTYFVQGSCALAVVAAYYSMRRRWAVLGWVTVGFLGGLVFAWFAVAAQRPQDFVPYVVNSLTIMSGFNAAMATPSASATLIWLALSMIILFAFQLGVFCIKAEDKPRAIFGSLFLVAMVFFLWKHAFTRWENHAQKFFFLMPELILASWLIIDKRSALHRVGLITTGVALTLALSSLEIAQKDAVIRASNRWLDQMQFGWTVVTGFSRYDQNRRANLTEAEKAHSLPHIKATIRNSTIDVLGYRQGIALLNRLNYAPRPIFQSYSAYTPSLIQINTAHYQSETSPAFVLSRLETLDGRFPTSEDAGVLVELLRNYRPAVAESGWQLWQLTPGRTALPPQPIGTVITKLGQSVEIPKGSAIWAKLEIDESRWGKVVSVLYKPAPVFLEAEDNAGKTTRYRIVPAMVLNGFLLNPTITNESELVAAAMGHPASRFVSFRIVVDPESEQLFKRNVKITFSALQLPEL